MIGISGELMEEFPSLDYYTKAAILESRINKMAGGGGREDSESSATTTSTSSSTSSLSSWFTPAGKPPPTPPTPAAAAAPAPAPRKTLGGYIAEMTTSSRYAVAHALLAALPVNEVCGIGYSYIIYMCVCGIYGVDDHD